MAVEITHPMHVPGIAKSTSRLFCEGSHRNPWQAFWNIEWEKEKLGLSGRENWNCDVSMSLGKTWGAWDTWSPTLWFAVRQQNLKLW